MKITLKFLKKFNACSKGIAFVKKNKLISLEAIDFIEKLIELDKLQWANWLTVRVLCKIDNVKYAVFAAEQVIDIFENKYPNDDRPRKAIESAKAYINNPCDADADTNAACDADAAYDAADATRAATRAAAYAAAYAAATATAAYAAHIAAYAAARAAARASRRAAWQDADGKILIKIIKNGIKLVKEATK